MFRKSSWSGTGSCVEFASCAPGIVVRDSKHPAGAWLTVGDSAWTVFLAAIKSGQFPAEHQTYRSMNEFLAELDQWRTEHPLRWKFNQLRGRLRSAWYQTRHIRWAYQRVTRGWDDRALWSLDHHLAATLGAQLLWLAEHAHGYPMDTTAEEWTSQLRTHGQALADYTAADSLDNTVDPPAAEAIHWVADNLGSLWD